MKAPLMAMSLLITSTAVAQQNDTHMYWRISEQWQEERSDRWDDFSGTFPHLDSLLRPAGNMAIGILGSVRDDLDGSSWLSSRKVQTVDRPRSTEATYNNSELHLGKSMRARFWLHNRGDRARDEHDATPRGD